MIVSMVYRVRNNDWQTGWCGMDTVERVQLEYSGVSVVAMSDKYEWVHSPLRKRFPHKAKLLRELKWRFDHYEKA